jgi:hypothetical protein
MARANEVQIRPTPLKGSSSSFALALAVSDGALLPFLLHPFHDVRKVSAVEALGAPDQCVVHGFPSIFDLFAEVGAFGFFRVAVVDCDWEEADTAFGEKFHAVQAVTDLVAWVFEVDVVAFHFGLRQSEVLRDAFGDGAQALVGATVEAVELEGLVHGLLLSLHFDCYAFLAELMLADAFVDPEQQKLQIFYEIIVEAYFVFLRAYFGLLQKDLQKD